MQSLQQSAPSENEDSIPVYRIVGLGFYTTTSAGGFHVDEVSISSEKRDFVWEEVGFDVHDIVLTACIRVGCLVI